MPSLSVLIPARNEEFLARTCQDLLEHTSDDTEIIAVIDGGAAGPAVTPHPRLRVIVLKDSIGQRAAQNMAAKHSTARYVMKLDAHCAVEPGFDRKMLAAMQVAGDDATLVAVMRNLHIFNWECDYCGAFHYQGAPPAECPECKSDAGHMFKRMIWNPKPNPSSSAYRFNKNLHFKYFPELRNTQARTGLQETMSLQGSCFMATRENYWARDLCDEGWGSWGQQGSEVALKTWLSGGRVLCNMDTWYAHLFRTQTGFSHPYPGVGASQENARRISQDVFLNDKWPKQTRPLAWLLEKFWAQLRQVGDAEARWEQADLDALKARPFSVNGKRYVRPPSKGIIYYTDGELPESIAAPVRERLVEISRVAGLPIVTAALKRRLAFGVKNIVFPKLKRGYLAMFKQILGALENSTADIVFFCEHDVLYHLSHFDFTPGRADTYYYNTNVYQMRPEDGKTVYWFCRKLSQMCCYRELAIAHYRKKVALVEANGGKYDSHLGFEPGTRGTRQGGVDDSGHGDWRSDVPNIDIRHADTLSKSKWSPDDFRNQANNIDWKEVDEIPGWGDTKQLFQRYERVYP